MHSSPVWQEFSLAASLLKELAIQRQHPGFYSMLTPSGSLPAFPEYSPSCTLYHKGKLLPMQACNAARLTERKAWAPEATSNCGSSTPSFSFLTFCCPTVGLTVDPYLKVLSALAGPYSVTFFTQDFPDLVKSSPSFRPLPPANNQTFFLHDHKGTKPLGP